MANATLEIFFRRIAKFFQDKTVPGSYGAFTTTGAPGGAAAHTAGATTPLGEYDVELEYLAGGTIGVAGITYRVSLDGGLTYLPNVAQAGQTHELGAATSIVIPNSGVTIQIGPGNVAANEKVSFHCTAPRMTATLAFGWPEGAKHVNQGPGGANRIVLTPADDDGELGPPTRVGGNPKHLWEIARKINVSIWAVDPARPRDPIAQVGAIDRLFAELAQAANDAAAGLHLFSDRKWVSPSENQFGKELRCTLTLAQPVTAIADVERPPDTVAVANVSATLGTQPTDQGAVNMTVGTT